MSKRPPTPKRAWVTMRAAVAFRSEKTSALLRDALGHEPPVAGEVWMNDKYVVTVVRRNVDNSVESLSIRRTDRSWPRDWRDFQHIKNDIASDEAEAVELFPAESRLMDTANQFWLFCLPAGEHFPFGFEDGRNVSNSEQAVAMGAGQRDPEGSES